VTAVAAAPVILFAPGAGAGSASAWMQGWRNRLASVAGAVETLDYPYRLVGRKAPDELPVLIAAHAAALAAARARHPAAPGFILAGKSMGGRVGCHVAAADPAQVAAVVCFGYPLRGTGGGMRDEVLLALRCPVLFVQGTRDPLCPLDLLEGVRRRMTAPHELFVVEGGNHSLEVPRKRGVPARARAAGAQTAPKPEEAERAGDPHEASDAAVLRAIRTFVEGLSARFGTSAQTK
jgi:predicted alpha/beta-hydrolase family hydrolase